MVVIWAIDEKVEYAIGGARVDKYKRNNTLRVLWGDSYKQIMNELMGLSTGKLALAI